ncbi:uncharacterized protein LOC128992539 isoform X2 [Macrosteles quadrilineatus]|uniref:uncharacterized protein LOC128992539 isoform X2 n=1 Tax=Macrosteles quadrilineatus TaxID=74068 RepID=UPI0023E26699|nr:uncharacterized protein LOC128992539 isoform X2 [Macrosteles quadrilineatus]
MKLITLSFFIGMTEEQKKDIFTTLECLDKKATGSTTYDELNKCLENVNKQVSEDEAKTMIIQTDTKGNGIEPMKIDVSKLMNHVFGTTWKTFEQGIVEAFYLFVGHNKDKLIDEDALDAGLKKYFPEDYIPGLAQTLIEEADSDNDGKLNKDEFIRAMLRPYNLRQYNLRQYNPPPPKPPSKLNKMFKWAGRRIFSSVAKEPKS